MKKLAIVFAFMFALVANTFAQADATPAPLKSEKESKADRKAGKGDRKAKMKKTADDLGLSDDQKAKMKDIGQSMKGKLKAIKTDATLSKDQKRAQMGEIAQSHETEIKAIMTPEQFTKYTAMKKERQANQGQKRDKKSGKGQTDNNGQ